MSADSKDEEASFLRRLFWPDRHRDGLVVARRVVVALWLLVCATQAVIWAVSCIVSGQLTSPWWLWTVGSGAAFVLAMWWFTGLVGRRRAS